MYDDFSIEPLCQFKQCQYACITVYVYYSYTHLWQELVYPWMHQSLLVPLTSYSHDFWGHRGNFRISCWHFLLWFVLHLLDKNKKKLKYRDSLVAHSMSYNVYINRSILSRKAQRKCTVHNLYLSKLSSIKKIFNSAHTVLLKRHQNLSCLSNSNFVFCKDFNYTIMPESSPRHNASVLGTWSFRDWGQLDSGLFRLGLDPLLLEEEEDTAASMSGRIPKRQEVFIIIYSKQCVKECLYISYHNDSIKKTQDAFNFECKR